MFDYQTVYVKDLCDLADRAENESQIGTQICRKDKQNDGLLWYF